MTWRAKFWWGVAVVSVVVNAVGAVYALRYGEWMHGGAHVAMLALTLFLVKGLRHRAVATVPERVQPAAREDDRMEQLQHAVDAIAIEVERIGEAQRFSAKLQAQQSEPSAERR
jgi:hypothetical protein